VTTRTKNGLGLLTFAVVAALTVWLVRRTQHSGVRTLDAVPADAFLVVTLDVDLLRGSPLGEYLMGGPGSRLLGDETLKATCGFDPLERMRELAVAVPMEDDTGEFGIAIRADLTKDELVECARKVIDVRGGGDQVTIRQSGSFTLVEPEGPLAKRYPTLAYREGGPFIVARGAWLGTIIDTTEGKLPSARRESRHLALRRDLGQASDDHPTFALLATVLLPKEMRERIRRDMGAEVASQSGDATGPELMAGVLGVEAAGLALSPGDGKGGETSAKVELRCEDEPSCASVARVIDKTRRGWMGDTTVHVLGLGALLDNLTVEPHGTSLRVATHAPADEVAKLLGRVLELRSGRRPQSALPPTTPRPSASSDEVIPSNAARPTRDARDAGEAAP
jgi:hypothetical protein